MISSFLDIDKSLAFITVRMDIHFDGDDGVSLVDVSRGAVYIIRADEEIMIARSVGGVHGLDTTPKGNKE